MGLMFPFWSGTHDGMYLIVLSLGSVHGASFPLSQPIPFPVGTPGGSPFDRAFSPTKLSRFAVTISRCDPQVEAASSSNVRSEMVNLFARRVSVGSCVGYACCRHRYPLAASQVLPM